MKTAIFLKCSITYSQQDFKMHICIFGLTCCHYSTKQGKVDLGMRAGRAVGQCRCM